MNIKEIEKMVDNIHEIKQMIYLLNYPGEKKLIIHTALAEEATIHLHSNKCLSECDDIVVSTLRSTLEKLLENQIKRLQKGS